MAWLAIADADRIQEYVFDAPRLRLIRGGSSLQRRCSVELAREQGGRVLRRDGGTAVALLRDAQREAFEQQAHAIYRQRTHSGTVTCAFVESDGSFPQTYKELQYRLERRKNSQATRFQNGGSPFWVACEACGRWPAAGGRGEERYCQTCLLKNAASGAGTPENFEWLAKQSHPENYLGIVYLDCDRLGKYVSDHLTNDPGSLFHLSRSISTAVRNSIRKALGTAGMELLLGGDDAYVALPADRAFPFVEDFQGSFAGQHFTNGASTLKRPTVSASIVIAHSHFPIAEFVRTAGELMRSAKSIEVDEDSVDYAIISESMAARAGANARRWTGRPYTISNLRNLRRGISGLRAKIAANKLNGLYRMAHESRGQGELEYRDLLRRLEDEQRKALRETVGPTLWADGRTVAGDVAELLEFC